jgi:hypothetical protein
MILSRYRYRPDTVTVPERYRFWSNVTQGYPPLRTVTQSLPNVKHAEFINFGGFKQKKSNEHVCK